jgi:hypothetical protein
VAALRLLSALSRRRPRLPTLQASTAAGRRPRCSPRSASATGDDDGTLRVGFLSGSCSSWRRPSESRSSP